MQPDYFELAKQLKDAICYADEYGLGVEFLGMFLKFQNVNKDTFDADISDALYEWDM